MLNYAHLAVQKVDNMEQEVQIVYSIKPIPNLRPEDIAWRRLNFNRLYISKLDLYPDENKVIITTSLSAEHPKDVLVDWITNHTYLEAFNTDITVEVIDVAEEREIYENE